MRDHPPALPTPGQRTVFALFLVNLMFQVLDGLATYLGVATGFGEGNPLLRSAMDSMGVGPALLLFKLEACACLGLVWFLRRSWLAGPALLLTALLYATCAIGPWALALAYAHLAPYALS